MGILQYDPTNSGGRWWLDTDDWKALESAGWTVHWVHDINDIHPEHPPGACPDPRKDPHVYGKEKSLAWGEHTHSYGCCQLVPATWNGGHWLGTAARGAAKQFASEEEGIAEWESILGKNPYEAGCECCGQPHFFSFNG
jgi:hypothetical protein